MRFGFLRRMRPLWVAAALGAAAAAGWVASERHAGKSSLTTEPATAPARPEEASGDAEPLKEAETAATVALSAWKVETPPGCPVFQSFSISKAAASRTSPTKIRLGA